MRPGYDHLKFTLIHTGFGLHKAFLLEHVYAYIYNKTIRKPGFLTSGLMFIHGHSVTINFETIKNLFDSSDLKIQTQTLKRVNDYVAEFKSHPPVQEVLKRLYEVRDYFQEHIKNKPSSLILSK